MEFWGVEVKPGATVKCEPEKERYIHLSQASLGESKGKGSESVLISVKVDDKKLVLGTLSLEKCPQISYDLVFEKEFELSHNSKSASVYFCGYRTGSPEDSEGDDYPESESEEENVSADLNANGKPLAKQEQGKPGSGKAKAARENGSAAKKAEPAKVEKPKSEVKEDEEDSDDSEDDSEEDSEDDEDMVKAMSDSDDEDEDEDEDDSSEEEDEATPKKAATGKRPAESASRTPAPEKKAKLVTPAKGQKTGDGKKVVHVATPHPSKKAGKTPANSDKSKQQTPKSAGSVTCKSCDRNFNSENALQAHTKAKHG